MELLLVVAVIGILAGGAYIAVSNVRDSSRVSKLGADVATINRAIDLYKTHGGGNLPAANAEPQAVLNQLKKVSASKYPGFSGSAIDVRLKAIASGAGAGDERAIWTGERFVIATTGSGVARFDLDDSRGATDPGTESRAAPIQLAGNNSWVWGFQEQAPLVPAGETRPARSGAGTGINPTAATKLQLSPPELSPSDGDHSLLLFDVAVTLSNSNQSGASEIVFIKNGTQTLYTGQTITVSPGETLLAYARTLDPNKWSDSAQAGGPYSPVPHPLFATVNVPAESLTYAEAGGAMAVGDPAPASAATVTITSLDGIDPQYVTSGHFQVYYTLDGADPLSSGTAGEPFSGAYVSPSIELSAASWGSNSTLMIRAMARVGAENLYENSTEGSETVGITPTVLGGPTIDPPSGQKAASLPVSATVDEAAGYPNGYRIYYTLDGSDPGNLNGSPVSGEPYNSETQISTGAGTDGMVTVTARVYGPEAYAHWFTPSEAAVVTYNTITLAEGALVGAATLNGTFVGSLVYASPPAGGSMSNITFNSNAKILNGNIYLPGTPSIRRTNGTVWSLANDHLFASIIQGWEFDEAGTKTVQTTPRVINENGSITPDNYSVTFNNSAVLEGKVIRRHNSPAFPTIDPPPPPDSGGSVALNSNPGVPLSASDTSTITLNTGAVGDVRLLPGNYSNLTANNGTAFVLGDPDNPEVTQFYSLSSLTLNSGSDLKIVGKVIVTVSGNINVNSNSVLGDIDHPEWFQLQFSSGNLTANSGSAIYGQLVAPTGSVVFNSGSVFQGSVTANQLTINSSSIVFNLPPVIEN